MDSIDGISETPKTHGGLFACFGGKKKSLKVDQVAEKTLKEKQKAERKTKPTKSHRVKTHSKHKSAMKKGLFEADAELLDDHHHKKSGGGCFGGCGANDCAGGGGDCGGCGSGCGGD